MTIAGIICEFNPFHDGHKYLIDSVRRDLSPGAVVCIMSGNFVQRGEPALWDKWSRAKAALEGGADLVLQMPVSVSLGAAASFAAGAVDIAAGVGCTHLCFGAEHPDLQMLEKIALLENMPETAEKSRELLQKYLDAGRGYAASYDAMVQDMLPETPEKLLSGGNNILGMEYMRRINEKGYSLQPYCVPIDETLGHAEDIRKEQNNDYVNTLYSLLRYKILTTPAEKMAEIPEIGEGLENRILSAVQKCGSLEELISAVSTKRYSRARVQRCLMQLLLDLRKTQIPAEPYAQVLAFRETGRQILRDSRIRLYSGISPRDAAENPSLASDVLADDIYSVLFGKELYGNSDYVCKPCKSKI